MRSYPFAPIAAREYPTVKLLDHPYIWGGVRFCVNVSQKAYPPELEAAMKERGIEWIHCPLSEKNPDWTDWEEKVLFAVKALYRAYLDGKKMVVHCGFGHNRSRTVVEAFHYLLTGEELQEEYKGEINHLAYNCKAGHLPTLAEMEKKLLDLKTEVKG